MIVNARKGTYTGEVNADGQAHGEGFYVNEKHKIFGLFVNNEANGLCMKFQPNGGKAIGEIKQKCWDGNYTFYDKDGSISNKEFKRGLC